MEDYSEMCDYESLKNQIKTVLKTYFEMDDSGEFNAEYDDNFSAQNALDAIHEIIGTI